MKLTMLEDEFDSKLVILDDALVAELDSDITDELDRLDITLDVELGRPNMELNIELASMLEEVLDWLDDMAATELERLDDALAIDVDIPSEAPRPLEKKNRLDDEAGATLL